MNEKPWDILGLLPLEPNKTEKMIYNPNKAQKTTLFISNGYPAESLEAKLRRMMKSKEPISDTAPLIYTDRKEGVKPEYDIRTDRFEVAIDAMEGVTQQHLANRKERHYPTAPTTEPSTETQP